MSSLPSHRQDQSAGHELHASPITSTLPIARWVSKSIQKSKECLEDMNKKLSTGQNESLTLRRARIDARRFQDGHPLKSQMPADLAEKGKDNGSPASKDEDSDVSLLLDTSTLFDSSTSPSDANGPRHPRHLTSNSSESEDSSDSSILEHSGSRLQRHLSGSPRPSSAPPNTSAHSVAEEEQRKARSLALKMLLQASAPVSASSPQQTTASVTEPQVLSSPPPPPSCIEKQPLSYGQRAVVMEEYLSRGTAFTPPSSAPSPSQFAQILFNSPMSTNDRATLLEDYIQRHHASTCSCRQSAAPAKAEERLEERMRNYLRVGGRIFECRPARTASRESCLVVDLNTKMWLLSYLRNGGIC